jgi:phosphoglycolate phosphatase-like HAD superfamily hydrolase
LGTLTAGVTIQKLKITGTAAPKEILHLAKEGACLYNPELAQSPDNAQYYVGTSVEIISDGSFGGRRSCAIFDNDGTISTLRQGWETVMEPVMVRSILGSEPAGADTKVVEQVTDAVKEYIDRTTGVQTLVQMHGLAAMVKDFGLVPEDEILEPEEYKEIYNRELLAMVNRRVVKVSTGEVAVEEVTMNNAVPFLRELKRRGVALYLASGTDEADVRRETELLGYAELFTGGIFGAVGNIDVEPKKLVMERILNDLGSNGMQSVVTFGDGPVEIRETKKQGGLTVGVASDEIKRSGLNESKRKRLILAGADLIVPDFSDMDAVLALLFKE